MTPGTGRRMGKRIVWAVWSLCRPRAFPGASQEGFQEQPQDRKSRRKSPGENRGENGAAMAVRSAVLGFGFVFHRPDFLCKSL